MIFSIQVQEVFFRLFNYFIYYFICFVECLMLHKILKINFNQIYAVH